MIDVAEYCLSKLSAREDYPFDTETAAFRIHDKIFALMPGTAQPSTINLKCDPVRALILRQDYPEITPGYHMNKKHWNTLDLTGTLPDDLIKELIDHSYDLVTGRYNTTK